VERGRFTNESIRRFQFQGPSNDFKISQQGKTNMDFGSDEAGGIEAVLAPVFVKKTTFYGDGIHKQVGETLKLECLVDGIPTPHIIWYKVKYLITNS
jgi:hypothetical protein